MVKAEYDSEGRTLWIELDLTGEPPKWADSVDVDAGVVVVLDTRERPAAVEVLDPSEHLGGLASAARSYDLDLESLRAAAQAALAAPDRPLTIEVGEPASV